MDLWCRLKPLTSFYSSPKSHSEAGFQKHFTHYIKELQSQSPTDIYNSSYDLYFFIPMLALIGKLSLLRHVGCMFSDTPDQESLDYVIYTHTALKQIYNIVQESLQA